MKGTSLKEVICLDDGNKYYFNAVSGLEAIHKALYSLNLIYKDDKATINLCNDRTWELVHKGKTYACLK